MSENRKYYFLKLKEDFFEQDTIVLLESLKDGILYSNILMKMYLKSLQFNGFLKVNERLSMTTEMIATLTRHEVGTVERAVKIFLELGLVETTETGTIYMSQIETLVGKSSTEGERKKLSRLRKERENSTPLQIGLSDTGGQKADICPQNVRTALDICPPEYRDKSIEIRDKNNINTFALSSGRQTSEPEADVEALILNDGSEWRPAEALFAEYVRLYPNVDVKQQFNEMRSWCLSNPKKRKTKRGITRFVNSWLGREQDRGYRRPSTGYQQAPKSGYGDRLKELENENRG